jgi:hypothetical protein
MRVEVIKTSGDKLHEEKWEFFLIDAYGQFLDFRLDCYTEYSRPSLRHKFRIDGKYYSRLNPRDSLMEESEVPFPEDVLNHARSLIEDKIRIRLWSEIK